MVKVNLRGQFGYGRPRVYYGPGVCEVPDGLARALGLEALPTPDEGAPKKTERRPDDAEEGAQIGPADALPARSSKPVQRGRR